MDWLDPTQLEPPEPGIGRTKLSQLKGQVFTKAALKKGMTTEELQRIKKLFSNQSSRDGPGRVPGGCFTGLVLDTSFDRYGMDDGCIVLFLVGFSQDRVDTPRRNKRSCIHRGFFYFTGHS